MKNVYGIRSFIATASISFLAIGIAYYIIAHKYTWSFFVILVFFDFIRTHAKRYHLITVNDRNIEFRSINPFRKKVVVTANSGSAITITCANNYSYLVNLPGNTQHPILRLSMHASEFNRLFQKLSASGFPVSTRKCIVH
jgi:hypothetical protein